MSSVMHGFRLSPTLRHHASFCAHDIHGSISVVSGTATDWKIHPALVWRGAGCVDDLPAFLPGPFARRLCLRAFFVKAADAPTAGDRAPDSVGVVACVAADHAVRKLEGARRRRSEPADSVAADGDDRAAVFRAVLDRPPDAAVVQPDESGCLTVSPLRAFERGLAPRVVELPNFFRGEVPASYPGDDVVGRPRGLRRVLRVQCLPRLEKPGQADRTRRVS